MDIDTAIGGDLQNLFGQNAAIGHHCDQIGGDLTKLGRHRAIFHFGGLVYRDTVLQGQLLHWRGRQLVPPAFGFIRLGVHRGHLMAVLYQSLQGGHRKFGCSHKNYTHGRASFWS